MSGRQNNPDRTHPLPMSPDREVEIRLRVAEGHWELGEREEALASLDLAAKVLPESRALRQFVESVRGEVEEGPLAFYLDGLRALLIEASTETIPDAGLFMPAESLPPGAEAFDAELVDAELVDAEPLEAEPSEAEPIEAEEIEAEPFEAEPLDAGRLEPEPVDSEPLEDVPLDDELLEGELLLDTEAPTTNPGFAFPASGAFHEPLPSTPTVAELLAEQGHTDRALAVTDDVLRRNPRDARALAMRERLVAGDHRKSAEVARVLERWLENAVRAGRRSQERGSQERRARERRVER